MQATVRKLQAPVVSVCIAECDPRPRKRQVRFGPRCMAPMRSRVRGPAHGEVKMSYPARRPGAGNDIPARRRIVVGVNGSAASVTALAWAAREARLRQAELRAVYAWEDTEPCRAPYAVCRGVLSRAEARAAAAALLSASVRAVFGPAPLAAGRGGRRPPGTGAARPGRGQRDARARRYPPGRRLSRRAWSGSPGLPAQRAVPGGHRGMPHGSGTRPAGPMPSSQEKQARPGTPPRRN